MKLIIEINPCDANDCLLTGFPLFVRLQGIINDVVRQVLSERSRGKHMIASSEQGMSYRWELN
jgi:hypothetical protein